MNTNEGLTHALRYMRTRSKEMLGSGTSIPLALVGQTCPRAGITQKRSAEGGIYLPFSRYRPVPSGRPIRHRRS